MCGSVVNPLEPARIGRSGSASPTNFASSSQGATITADTLGDQDERDAGYQSTTTRPRTTARAGRERYLPRAGERPVVRDRARRRQPERQRDQAAGRLRPARAGNNRFTALRSFDAYACRAGKDKANPTCDGRSTPVDGSFRPRPTRSPSWTRGRSRRTMTLATSTSRDVATHIKFAVTNNQCTGQPADQGDQDNDPDINSDCAPLRARPRGPRQAPRFTSPSRGVRRRTRPCPALEGHDRVARVG